MGSAGARDEGRVKRYSLERSMMDRWARWRRALGAYGAAHLYYPRRNVLHRMAELGVRTQPVSYEPEPGGDDIEEQIESFMDSLRSSQDAEDRYIHLCLEARHRRTVGSLSVESLGPRGLTEREMARVILGVNDDAAVMRFRRLCERGYSQLADWLGG